MDLLRAVTRGENRNTPQDFLQALAWVVIQDAFEVLAKEKDHHHHRKHKSDRSERRPCRQWKATPVWRSKSPQGGGGSGVRQFAFETGGVVIERSSARNSESNDEQQSLLKKGRVERKKVRFLDIGSVLDNGGEPSSSSTLTSGVPFLALFRPDGSEDLEGSASLEYEHLAGGSAGDAAPHLQRLPDIIVLNKADTAVPIAPTVFRYETVRRLKTFVQKHNNPQHMTSLNETIDSAADILLQNVQKTAGMIVQGHLITLMLVLSGDGRIPRNGGEEGSQDPKGNSSRGFYTKEELTSAVIDFLNTLEPSLLVSLIVTPMAPPRESRKSFD